MRGLDLDLPLFVTSALLAAGNTSRGKVKGPPDLSRCSQARPQAFIGGQATHIDLQRSGQQRLRHFSFHASCFLRG